MIYRIDPLNTGRAQLDSFTSPSIEQCHAVSAENKMPAFIKTPFKMNSVLKLSELAAFKKVTRWKKGLRFYFLAVFSILVFSFSLVITPSPAASCPWGLQFEIRARPAAGACSRLIRRQASLSLGASSSCGFSLCMGLWVLATTALNPASSHGSGGGTDSLGKTRWHS